MRAAELVRMRQRIREREEYVEKFKMATNTTPVQYLQEMRISHAKDLLKKSNLGISEVADKVGYQDSSYFTGLFKKLNSVTPNEYRRLVRNKLFVAESKQQSIQ